METVACYRFLLQHPRYLILYNININLKSSLSASISHVRRHLSTANALPR